MDLTDITNEQALDWLYHKLEESGHARNLNDETLDWTKQALQFEQQLVEDIVNWKGEDILEWLAT